MKRLKNLTTQENATRAAKIVARWPKWKREAMLEWYKRMIADEA